VVAPRSSWGKLSSAAGPRHEAPRARRRRRDPMALQASSCVRRRRRCGCGPPCPGGCASCRSSRPA